MKTISSTLKTTSKTHTQLEVHIQNQVSFRISIRGAKANSLEIYYEKKRKDKQTKKYHLKEKKQ